jgi:CelD/BcsL family acetyltransferase involved in cellulose biosynthesis
MRVDARPIRTFPVSQSSVGDCRMTNTGPIMSTGIWPAAVASSSGTPAWTSLAANHIRAPSPKAARGNPAPAISASSGASLRTAVVRRVTEAVERLRLLCGVVDKQTDNRPARPLCCPAADATSRAIGRRRPRRNPPHSSRAWAATISTQVPGWGAFM